MSELPSVTGKQALSAFEQHGFKVVRICGSHHIMKKTAHRFVLSVPVNRNKRLKPGTLRGLINAAGITVEEFRDKL